MSATPAAATAAVVVPVKLSVNPLLFKSIPTLIKYPEFDPVTLAVTAVIESLGEATIP